MIELTAYKGDVTIPVYGTIADTDVYIKKDVDAAIAELKAKLEDVNELIKTARQMLEDAKATHYTEMVDAGMRERRLKRSLWMHRAITAKFNKEACKAMREYNPFIGIEEYKWQEVERKCLAKAEQYK